VASAVRHGPVTPEGTTASVSRKKCRKPTPRERYLGRGPAKGRGGKANDNSLDGEGE
jgi:hypothetical protein